MKKTYGILALSMMLGLASCDSKLDIIPLGKTTLDKVEDLESLLEQKFMLSTTLEYETLCGNTYPEAWETPESILADRTTSAYAMLAGDESVDRVELAISDNNYENIYEYINYANVVISKIDDASGDSESKRRIKAEAKILRAWFHFLAVNMYAGQYDEATAADTGGVAYVDNYRCAGSKNKIECEGCV